MKPTLEEYCRSVDEQAARIAREEAHSHINEHLRAFNFGRMTQRVENARNGAWLQLGWLLAGTLLGFVLGTAMPRGRSNSLTHQILSRANRLAQQGWTSSLGRGALPPA
jgi:hypothetical protein